VPATFRTQVHEYGLFPLNKTLKSDSSSFHRLRTHFLVPILGTLHHQGLSLRPSATARQRCEHTHPRRERTGSPTLLRRHPIGRKSRRSRPPPPQVYLTPEIPALNPLTMHRSRYLHLSTSIQRFFAVKSTILLCPLKILTSSHHESVPYERRCQGYAKGSFQLAACVCYRERLHGWVLVWL
jgi:hypothetical protein